MHIPGASLHRRPGAEAGPGYGRVRQLQRSRRTVHQELVVDKPPFALVIVTDPWNANSNSTYAVIGGLPTIQLVNDRLDLITRELPDTFAPFTAAVPNLSTDAY